jgi:hypothetical protein
VLVRRVGWNEAGAGGRMCDSKVWPLLEAETPCAERPCLLVRMGVLVGSIVIETLDFRVWRRTEGLTRICTDETDLRTGKSND